MGIINISFKKKSKEKKSYYKFEFQIIWNYRKVFPFLGDIKRVRFIHHMSCYVVLNTLFTPLLQLICSCSTYFRRLTKLSQEKYVY